MREILLKEVPSEPPGAQVAVWFITDALSHPAWDQYIGLLAHLREQEGIPAPYVYGECTHEFILYACHPDYRLPDVFTGVGEEHGVVILSPPNYGYQIKADSDAHAVELLGTALNNAPSLDTDFRSIWNEAFRGHYSLMNNEGWL